MAEEQSTDGTGCPESASIHTGNPKYGLRPRSIINRIETERRRQEPAPKKKEPKKHRPPPLSKYRRKNANARERHRMHEINQAFEALRCAIPAHSTESTPKQNESQLTKITTLKMAMNYIQALSDMIKKDDEDKQGGSSDNSVTSPSTSSGLSETMGTPVTSPAEFQSWSPYCHVISPQPPHIVLFGKDHFLTPSPTPSPEAYATTSTELIVRQTGPLPPVETLLKRPQVDLAPPSACLSDYLAGDTGFSDVFDSFPPLGDFPDVSDSSIEILLESDGESLTLSSDFSDQPTP